MYLSNIQLYFRTCTWHLLGEDDLTRGLHSGTNTCKLPRLGEREQNYQRSLVFTFLPIGIVPDATTLGLQLRQNTPILTRQFNLPDHQPRHVLST